MDVQETKLEHTPLLASRSAILPLKIAPSIAPIVKIEPNKEYCKTEPMEDDAKKIK